MNNQVKQIVEKIRSLGISNLFSFECVSKKQVEIFYTYDDKKKESFVTSLEKLNRLVKQFENDLNEGISEKTLMLLLGMCYSHPSIFEKLGK